MPILPVSPAHTYFCQRRIALAALRPHLFSCILIISVLVLTSISIRKSKFTDLYKVIFLVSVPSNTIARDVYFVSGGPLTVSSPSLCCHSTNRTYSTHINLKIVCAAIWRSLAPTSISPVCVQSAVVRIITSIIDWTCRHSIIWYCASICYTYRPTYWNKTTTAIYYCEDMQLMVQSLRLISLLFQHN